MSVAVAPGRTISLTRARALAFVFIGLGAFGAWAFGLGSAADVHSTFGLNPGGVSPAAHLPDLTLPTRTVALALSAVAMFLGGVQFVRGFGRRTYLVLGVVAALFVLALLTWAARGTSLNLVGMLQSSLLQAVPLTLGALSGVLCERSGVINIAIEGMFLAGAFVGALVGSAAGQWVGLGAAVLLGGLFGGLLAVLAIRYRVDQIIAGAVINILSLGVTSFLSARILQRYQNLNSPDRFAPIQIPLLSKIPVVGPILFDNSLFVYVMLGLVAVVHVGLFSTRWGLRVRAVGEHPKAADTVGIRVLFTRYRNVIMGGMVAGFGGAYFTLGSVGRFDENMTAGRGFIALAAMIFGRWNPIGAFGAALVFGFADALQNKLSILSVGIPSEFLLMTPYLVTILVVAGVVGRARPPAADGKPYIKE